MHAIPTGALEQRERAHTQARFREYELHVWSTATPRKPSDSTAEIARRFPQFVPARSGSSAQSRSGISGAPSADSRSDEEYSEEDEPDGHGSADIVGDAEHLARSSFRRASPARDWSHVDRVRKSALRLARACRRSDEGKPDLLTVELASLLHDVGADDRGPVRHILDTFFARHSAHRHIAHDVTRIVEAIGDAGELRVERERGESSRRLDSIEFKWSVALDGLHLTLQRRRC